MLYTGREWAQTKKMLFMYADCCLKGRALKHLIFCDGKVGEQEYGLAWSEIQFHNSHTLAGSMMMMMMMKRERWMWCNNCVPKADRALMYVTRSVWCDVTDLESGSYFCSSSEESATEERTARENFPHLNNHVKYIAASAIVASVKKNKFSSEGGKSRRRSAKSWDLLTARDRRVQTLIANRSARENREVN